MTSSQPTFLSPNVVTPRFSILAWRNLPISPTVSLAWQPQQVESLHQPRHCTRHGRVHVAGAGAGQGAGCTDGFILVRSGLIRKWRQARCLFVGESFGNNIHAILERQPVPAVRLNPDLPTDSERIINRALRKRPRTALSRRSGNAFRVDAAEAGYRFGAEFHHRGALQKLPHARSRWFTRQRDLHKRIRFFSAACFALLAAGFAAYHFWPRSKPSKRPLKDYANKPVEQTNERLRLSPRWQSRIGRIVYLSPAGGSDRVFLMLTSGGQPLQLTNDEGDKGMINFWSDGKESITKGLCPCGVVRQIVAPALKGFLRLTEALRIWMAG